MIQPLLTELPQTQEEDEEPIILPAQNNAQLVPPHNNAQTGTTQDTHAQCG